MKFAVISDVHSNLEALECTLSEIKKRGSDKIICLGDAVGYGANPSECLAIFRSSVDVVIMGNHDQAIFDIPFRDYFNPRARRALEWTAEVLSEQEKRQIKDFLPVTIDQTHQVTWAHSSIHEPLDYHYIFTQEDASPSLEILKTNFCFFGHTHFPSLFSAEENKSQYLPAGIYQLKKNSRCLINPGSVGQPRDKNPKLSFAFFDSESLKLEIVRLAYDNVKAADKIRKAGLPEYFAERLL